MNFFKRKQSSSSMGHQPRTSKTAEKTDWESGSSKENRSNSTHCSEGSVKGSRKSEDATGKVGTWAEFIEQMDVEEIKKKAASGKFTLEHVFEEMHEVGGREEWSATFKKKMEANPKGYADTLTKLRTESLQDKTMKKHHRLYKRNGRSALEVEIEDEFDLIPENIRDKLLKLQAPLATRNLHARGKTIDAMEEFRHQYVKDKVNHIISLVDDSEFEMMRMLVTGDGIRIPPQAILKSSIREKEAAAGNMNNSGRKQSKAELTHKQELAQAEAELRDALQKNDTAKMDEVVAKLKKLKSVDMYGKNMPNKKEMVV